ncbi:MAG: pirin family protein [Bacteroidetes bacterium]|nr:pirin family protein [Bacteroidota bacterium]
MKSSLKLYTAEDQARGAFDGGRITEIKPIGFRGEGSKVTRLGPLFYWAWATSHEKSVIALHPHQGFEIISYVIEGEIGHYDTLGGNKTVGTGGLQGMQTGSGVSHEESFKGKTDFFQIWFEPNLREAMQTEPKYWNFYHDDFPLEQYDGITIKTIIGTGSKVKMTADVKMWDIKIESNHEFQLELNEKRYLAVVVISGGGNAENESGSLVLTRTDFLVVETFEKSSVTFTSNSADHLRLSIVEVPVKVDYPLYPNF